MRRGAALPSAREHRGPRLDAVHSEPGTPACSTYPPASRSSLPPLSAGGSPHSVSRHFLGPALVPRASLASNVHAALSPPASHTIYTLHRLSPHVPFGSIATPLQSSISHA